MKLVVTKILTDFDGVQPLKMPPPKKDEDLTVKEYLANVLGSFGNCSGKENLHAYNLGVEIFRAKEEVILTSEDVVFLKKVIEDDKRWTAIVKGQVLDLLDEKKETLSNEKPGDTPIK